MVFAGVWDRSGEVLRLGRYGLDWEQRRVWRWRGGNRKTEDEAGAGHIPQIPMHRHTLGKGYFGRSYRRASEERSARTGRGSPCIRFILFSSQLIKQ
jgi:hypothetical protein